MSNWPHAPAHHFDAANIFFITAGTYAKQHFYLNPAALDELQSTLFTKAHEHACWLQAWCLLSNHYHLVIRADGNSVRRMIAAFHSESARHLNKRDRVEGRRVWYQFWDKTLTFESSWLARLRYTHENAVHHGVVRRAIEYRWCSAAWFERTAKKPFVDTVRRMKIDSVKIFDEFEPKAAAGPPHS